MRAAGEEATSLVEEVHSWVKFEELLKVCSSRSQRDVYMCFVCMYVCLYACVCVCGCVGVHAREFVRVRVR